MNHKHSNIPPYIFGEPNYDCPMALYLKRSTCKYFSYEMVYFRADYSTGPPPPYKGKQRIPDVCQV